MVKKVCQHLNKKSTDSVVLGDLDEIEITRYLDCEDCNTVFAEREIVHLEPLLKYIEGKRKIKIECIKK